MSDWIEIHVQVNAGRRSESIPNISHDFDDATIWDKRSLSQSRTINIAVVGVCIESKRLESVLTIYTIP